MVMNRCIVITLLLSFMLPSMLLHAKEVVVVDSSETEGKVLLKEGLFLAIDKEEFKQFIEFVSITRNQALFVSFTTSFAIATMGLALLVIDGDLRDIGKALRC